IGRPLPAVMVFFVLCVAGLWGFHKLPVARFPDIAFPMVTVTVMQPGAAPSQLEAEVTRRVEDSVATIPNIKRIMSSVNEGVSTTSIEFQLETDLATALDDTRDAVTRIRTDLPQDIQEPVISKVDIGGALMTYALVAPRMTADEASWFVDREVTRAMYGVPGVAEVTRVGGVDRQVRVDLDPISGRGHPDPHRPAAGHPGAGDLQGRHRRRADDLRPGRAADDCRRGQLVRRPRGHPRHVRRARRGRGHPRRRRRPPGARGPGS